MEDFRVNHTQHTPHLLLPQGWTQACDVELLKARIVRMEDFRVNHTHTTHSTSVAPTDEAQACDVELLKARIVRMEDFPHLLLYTLLLPQIKGWTQACDAELLKARIVRMKDFRGTIHSQLFLCTSACFSI